MNPRMRAGGKDSLVDPYLQGHTQVKKALWMMTMAQPDETTTKLM